MADKKEEVKSPADKPAAAAPADAKGKNAKPKRAMPILQPREMFFLKIFIFCFMLLIIDLVMIHPITDYLQRLDESISTKEQVIPKKLLILKHKDRIMNEYKALVPFFVDPALSQEEETAQFLREIERVSKEVNFFVSNIEPVKVNKKSDSIYELSLQVEGRGGLREIPDFIRRVERVNPTIRISAFALKPQDKEANELKVQFSIIKLGVKKPSV